MWLVISDSHDSVGRLKEAVRLGNERGAEALFHCGDIISPFAAKELLAFNGRLFATFGNNDGEVAGLKNVLGDRIFKGPSTIEMGGIRVALMHEPFAVGSSPDDCDFLFYGHTHQLDVRVGKTLIINPGELCGYLSGSVTCVLVGEEDRTYEILEL